MVVSSCKWRLSVTVAIAFGPFAHPKPEDTATICYTSGTTGTQKGR